MAKEELLSSGWIVGLRPVPPHVMTRMYLSLPEPKVPQVTLQGRGGSETARALPGSPEWNQYQDDLARYQKISTVATEDFLLLYGVVYWRREGTEPSENMTKAPEDFTPDTTLADFGVQVVKSPFSGPKVTWIQQGLILTHEDDRKVRAVLEQALPAINAEVMAAMTPFGSPTSADNL